MPMIRTHLPEWYSLEFRPSRCHSNRSSNHLILYRYRGYCSFECYGNCWWCSGKRENNIPNISLIIFHHYFQSVLEMARKIYQEHGDQTGKNRFVILKQEGQWERPDIICRSVRNNICMLPTTILDLLLWVGLCCRRGGMTHEMSRCPLPLVLLGWNGIIYIYICKSVGKLYPVNSITVRI